ncbi:integrase [Flavobacterium supellecticarium]|uniref:Integrase n=1 Tax=Flavobacterium supellecticarium TaxID=2565924 RepID=A0A4S4A361_9FLAO|nr:tyrosine-type recombinase/integrase [Flavobacterium supellecticarium]THF52841.1 integrase [Flavobacterium supellecticarium]
MKYKVSAGVQNIRAPSVRQFIGSIYLFISLVLFYFMQVFSPRKCSYFTFAYKFAYKWGHKMQYVTKVGANYYYYRRIPEIVREYDRRIAVRVALKTDSKRLATRKASMFNEQMEAYWQSLVAENKVHSNSAFRKTVRIARQLGFSYQPMAVVAKLPDQEIVERILVLPDASPKQVEAVLGGRPEPELKVKQALELFWKLSKDRTINKTENQSRKWRNPRIKAVENFVHLNGDMDMKQITREHTWILRDWWVERIKTEDKNPSSANKDFIHLKDVLQTVSDHEKLGLDTDFLFKKIKLKTRFKQARLPFSNEQIINILQSEKLHKLNVEARWFLHVAAETGARPSEIVGLLPEDIKLDADIPYISITDRKERPLKNYHSQRNIPLVGYALKAFKAMPNGFPKYRDKPDLLSATTNKFLREHGLLPSDKHSVYSFRHSFQDRILKVNTPDRVQAELMGHKFSLRPNYGNGADLEQKLEWLVKIKLSSEERT